MCYLIKLNRETRASNKEGKKLKSCGQTEQWKTHWQASRGDRQLSLHYKVNSQDNIIPQSHTHNHTLQYIYIRCIHVSIVLYLRLGIILLLCTFSTLLNVYKVGVELWDGFPCTLGLVVPIRNEPNELYSQYHEGSTIHNYSLTIPPPYQMCC